MPNEIRGTKRLHRQQNANPTHLPAAINTDVGRVRRFGYSPAIGPNISRTR